MYQVMEVAEAEQFILRMEQQEYIQEFKTQQQERYQVQRRVDGHLMDGMMQQVEEIKY